MIYWAQLLHFYQPPTQFHPILEKVCQESYYPLLKVLRSYPHARLTVNINAVLTDLLHQHGYGDVVQGLRELAESGQIEFTGSGKYHPILPLLPPEEVRRQVQHNFRTNRQFLGPAYSPQGFFPPELCYSPALNETIADAGYRWVIVSGVSCPVDWPLDVIHHVDSDGQRLAVIFRDDILSNKISFQSVDSKSFLEHLAQLQGGKRDIYVVTAMDAETYGHHIEGWEKVFLAGVYEELEPVAVGVPRVGTTSPGPRAGKFLAEQHRGLLTSTEMAEKVRPVKVSELLDLFPAGNTIEPKPASWSSSDGDLAAGNPYPLWNEPGNRIHRLLWEHLNLCIDMTHWAQQCARNSDSQRYVRIARGMLDRAEHSCQFWWASRAGRDANLVHKGLLEQEEAMFNAYKAVAKSDAPEERKRDSYYRVLAARDIRDRIRDLLLEM
ncbi:MAG: hypothetical protein HYY01_07120 [Chloroflexi bacterium]|nr:hypothetical protein [Chloroflexota bacterium]